MKTNNLGILLLVIGTIIIIYCSFNFLSADKVVDLGSVKIIKAKNQALQWSPIIGVAFLVSGGVILLFKREN
jgi:LPXTG-motif cell wall-anchored protein